MTTGSAVIQRAVHAKALDWIVGIDPSVTETGYCRGRLGRFSKEPDRNWDAQVVRHPKHMKGMDRVHNTVSTIGTSLYLAQPKAVFMEGYAYSRGKVGRVFDLAETGMAIKLVVLRMGIPIIIVPPTTLKQFVTGKGNAGKPEVAASIQQQWGARFSNDNKADAFALMLYGQYLLGMLDSDALEEPQVKALQKAELIEAGLFAEI